MKTQRKNFPVLNNTDQNTLALATLSINRSEIVIAFRGTWNAWNVVTDGMITVRSEPDNPQVKVHQGFRMATMSLFDKVSLSKQNPIRDVLSLMKTFQVVAIIRKLLIENPGFKVVLTGHSLGGAMASLTYYFITYRQLFPNATFEVYTYGEPRVGNKYFADFMNCQRMVTARVVARYSNRQHNFLSLLEEIFLLLISELTLFPTLCQRVSLVPKSWVIIPYIDRPNFGSTAHVVKNSVAELSTKVQNVQCPWDQRILSLIISFISMQIIYELQVNCCRLQLFHSEF